MQEKNKETYINRLLSNVPTELKEIPNWVVHRNKIPLSCRTLKACSSTKPEDWSYFPRAMYAYRNKEVDGIGFCFQPPYIGVDIDKSLDLSLAKKLMSYTEYSPSGKGLHILGKGTIPSAHKTQGLEIYTTGRFFTVTGNAVPGFPKQLSDLTAPLSGYFTKSPEQKHKSDDWIAESLTNIHDGNIHNVTIEILGRFRRDGYSKASAEALIWPRLKEIGSNREAFEQRMESVYKLYQPKSKETIQYGEERKPIELITPSSHAQQYQKALFDPEARANSELPTGIPSIDRYTNGLAKGRIWVVGARTNIGKTSFSITICEEMLKRNKRVLFFSTEMDYSDIFDRFTSIGTGLSLTSFNKKRFNETDKRLIGEYCDKFESKNLFIFDGAEPDIREVSEAISRVRPDVLVFDHIQRVANRTNQRALELSRFIKELNTLCRKYKVAGIVNSQLNRVAELERPQLHHLKECGALEEEAKTVILLSFLDKNTKLIMADIAKNKGPHGEVQLKLDSTTCKFEEV